MALAGESRALFTKAIWIQLPKSMFPSDEIIEDNAPFVPACLIRKSSFNRMAFLEFFFTSLFHGIEIGSEIPVGLPNGRK